MPSNPQSATATAPATPPAGVTFGDPAPSGLTYGAPDSSGPPSGVTFGDAAPTHHWYDEGVNQLKELNTGFTTALSQTGLTAQKAIGALPVVGPAFTRATEQARAEDVKRAAEPMNTPGRMSGNMIENILEFAAGDEALKGASFLTKMDALQPLMQALKKSPTAVQVMSNMVAQGARGAALTGGQAAVHGQTPEQIRNAALLGGGIGAIAEPVTAGVSSIVNAIRPGTVEALGEQLPALASQQQGAAPLAKDVAGIGTEPRTAAAQQIGAQRALTTRAQQIAQRELENLNTARQARWQAGTADINLAPTPDTTITDATRQLPSGQPQLPESTASTAPQIEAGQPPTGMARTGEIGQYEGELPEQPPQPTQPTTTQPTAAPTTPRQRVSYIEERPPNFQPIDSQAEASGVNTFGDAADKIREHAAPIYDRINTASDGEFTKLRVARDQAYAQEDYQGVRDAEKQIDNLFDSDALKGKVDRTDYRAAKSAWRSSKILDAVHDAVNRGFNIADPSLAEDAGVWRGINGGKLQTGINRLTKEYGRTAIDQVLGPDGMTGLQRIASLLQTPRYAQGYGQVIGSVADDVVASAATHTGSAIPKTLNWARSLVLHRVATDPKFSKMVSYAVTHRVPQSVATAALSAMLNQSGPPRPTTNEQGGGIAP